MTVRRSIDELNVDTQLVALAAHASFEQVAHSKLSGHRRRLDILALVDEGGVAGDDEQAGDFG